jgi:hypothetical protein
MGIGGADAKRGAHRVSPDIRYDRLSTHRPYSLLLIVLLQRDVAVHCF